MKGLDLDATNNSVTYQIIGKAMGVHNQLGPGYKEEVYEKALFFALNEAGLETERQYRLEIMSDRILRRARNARAVIT